MAGTVAVTVALEVALLLVGVVLLLVSRMTLTDNYRRVQKWTKGLSAVFLGAGLIVLFTHLTLDWP